MLQLVATIVIIAAVVVVAVVVVEVKHYGNGRWVNEARGVMQER